MNYASSNCLIPSESTSIRILFATSEPEANGAARLASYIGKPLGICEPQFVETDQILNALEEQPTAIIGLNLNDHRISQINQTKFDLWCLLVGMGGDYKHFPESRIWLNPSSNPIHPDTIAVRALNQTIIPCTCFPPIRSERPNDKEWDTHGETMADVFTGRLSAAIVDQRLNPIRPNGQGRAVQLLPSQCLTWR